MPQIKTELERLLEAKFVRTTRYTECLVNLVLAKKRNGKICVCINYRDLNLATPKEEYLMPIADMLVGAATTN